MQQTQDVNSRNIPHPIQREVRQRCGFGCVICGLPLYEYEHMNEWSKVKVHIAKDITLLCDRHHREKTAGLLPKTEVVKANENPYNLRNGVSKPYDLFFNGDSAEVEFGSNKFSCQANQTVTTLVPLTIDCTPLIGLRIIDQHILLNITIFDKYNQLILNIIDNQLSYSVMPWDIQLVGTVLTIRERPGRILIEFNFQPPTKIILTRGRMYFNGIELKIDKERITINKGETKQIVEGNSGVNTIGGLSIGFPKPNYGSAIYLPLVERS